MMKFRLGDKVKSMHQYDRPPKGILGTILGIAEENEILGIEWDENICGHDLGGSDYDKPKIRPCKDGHGWNSHMGYVIKVDNQGRPI